MSAGAEREDGIAAAGGAVGTVFDAPAAAVARAPGRVNLIGEHTDYNGGLVLPAAIDLYTEVRLRFRDDAIVRGRSREAGEDRADLEAPPTRRWLDYPRGVARALAEAKRIPAHGFDLEVRSDVPEGAGLSSSAALEAASALALLAAAGAPLRDSERLELARLCRRAESGFVGLPCGLMDPYAVLCGVADGAVLLDCATERSEVVRLPADAALLIVDTGVKHALREGGYVLRTEECARALEETRAALGRDLPHLSALRLSDLGAVGGRIEAVAFRRARHVVSENARVREFAARLRAGDLPGAGQVMVQSHESLRVDYEVTCEESDALVDDAQSLPGCFGSRMTGGGWGGCTVHLVDAARAEAVAESLARRFEARFGRAPRHWRVRAAAGAVRL